MVLLIFAGKNTMISRLSIFSMIETFPIIYDSKKEAINPSFPFAICIKIIMFIIKL